MNNLQSNYYNEIVALLDASYVARTNNIAESLKLCEQALILSNHLGNNILIAKSYSYLSLFLMIKGDHTDSMHIAGKAVKVYEELKDEKGIADVKYTIASIYYKTDNFHLGLVYFLDCLVVYQKYDDFQNQSRVYKALGTIYEFFSDQNNALLSYENSIAAAKKANDLNAESNAYNPLSGIYLKQGNVDRAWEIIDKAIAIKTATNDVRGMAFSVYGRGKIYLVTGRYDLAEKDFTDSAAIHKSMGEPLGLGMAYYKIAILYRHRGLLEKARDMLLQTLELSKRYNIMHIKMKCNKLLYGICKEQGNTMDALKYLEDHIKEKETVINTQVLKVIESYELITKMEALKQENRLQREKTEILEKKNFAEQSAKVKQDFLSNMSHEIRTPLNAVITITSLLGEKENPEEKELLESLKFASNNLLRIINDILDFSKLEADKLELDFSVNDFPKLLGNIKNTYENLAKEKGIKLILNPDPALSGGYEIDDTRISQILGNLITNAIKFTSEGSVMLQVEKINTDGQYDRILFTVRDTGVGIPQKNIVEIFDNFSQPKAITTKKHGGTGLGLAIVKKLVELHGSTIYVESIVDKGSAFHFELNLKRAAMQHSVAANNSTELKGKKILLAEDNPINAMVAIKLLSKWGIETEHAINGLIAVEKSKLACYDFILMDIHMPEMDGYEAVENIKNCESNPNYNTPVFALTADIMAEKHNQASQHFKGFLTKPIDINKLYDSISTYAGQ